MNLPLYEIDQDISNKIFINENVIKNFDNHFHKKFELYYIISGKFNIGINDKIYSFEKDDIAFIPEFYSHYGFSESTGDEIVFIPPHNLTGDICALLKDKTLPCNMCDKKFNKQIILPILNTLKNDKSIDKDIIAKGYINILIGSLFYHYNSVEIEKGENIEFIVSVLKYIDSHYKDNITLEKLSSVFGYNKFYFSRQFNKLVKMSINEYLNFVRLQKFISIFSSDEKIKITDLAFDCGFDSLSTFYRAFYKVYNLKPKQYFKI